MLTLGIHGGTNTATHVRLPTPPNWLHDAAAVLCRDGQVVAAAEEERFVRIKHVSHFPLEAIRYCLSSQNVSLADVEWIVLSSEHMNNFLRIENRWRYGTRWWLERKSFVQFASEVLSREFGVDVRDRIVTAGHHRSHILSAVCQAGFSECLCVALDGRGDGLTGMVASYRDNRLTVLRTMKELGPAAMYLRGTEILGFSQFDEYKVMGLAPYGNTAATDSDAEPLVRLLSNGEFRVSIPKVIEVAAARRAFRTPDCQIEDRHTRFAAAVQRAVERAVFHLARYYRSTTDHRYLCFVGGLAQNCTITGKLLASGLFDDVFVPPAAYDAGCAIGAAIHGYVHATGGGATTRRLTDVSWGVDTPNDNELREFLTAWTSVVDVEVPADICATTAQLLSEGSIVGWVQGRAEFGARALGNRSILADPRPAANKDRINAMIKKREAFRPFAPSVLDEHLHRYFDVPASVRSLPFMVFVVNVRPEYRTLLGAVTHVDGSARVQSVSRESNERFWRLIKAFQDRAGIPIVLNTSFNTNAEPIVNTPLDAMNCFLSTQIDYWVVGGILVRRKHKAGDRAILPLLLPRLSHRFALTQCASADGAVESGIQDRYTNDRVPASLHAYRCLTAALENRCSFGDAIARMQMPPQVSARVIDELWLLWERRVFTAIAATGRE